MLFAYTRKYTKVIAEFLDVCDRINDEMFLKKEKTTVRVLGRDRARPKDGKKKPSWS